MAPAVVEGGDTGRRGAEDGRHDGVLGNETS